ncbi:MAG: SGNH/GDSL hydrolase family protein, partial [Gemmataceae bacterium]
MRSTKLLGVRALAGLAIAAVFGSFGLVAYLGLRAAPVDNPPLLKLAKGNRIVLIGNTLPERMQHDGYFETLLHTRFPTLELVVRNLGWSADELTLRPRSLNFKDHGHTLTDHKADVVLAFFGFNESFGGKDGLAKFENDLEGFIKETTSTKYNGKNPPQLVLISPIANEDLPERGLSAGKDNNANIELYTQAMKKIADKHKVPFVDVFTPTKSAMEKPRLSDAAKHRLT